MAKKAAKRTAKSGTTKRPKSLSSLLGKAGTKIKIISLNKTCVPGESAGRFTLEGTFSKPKSRSKKTK